MEGGVEEGKKGMIFAVYKKLYDVLHTGEKEDCLFACPFRMVQWDLITRSNKYLMVHINQTGERPSDPWHVYSNLNNPSLCPILSLAKYLFSNTDLLKNNYKLPPHKYQ